MRVQRTTAAQQHAAYCLQDMVLYIVLPVVVLRT
jgi:hypothetical protein